MDDGYLSPPRLTAPREWDYAGFVRFWGESSGEWRDVLQCFRRDCFTELRQPEGQMDDVKFLLDFAKKFRIRAYPDVLLLYHQDAGNQMVDITSRVDPRRDRQFIQDRANEFRDLLHVHGDFVAHEAPALYGEYLQSATTTATMANRRGEAFGYAIDLIRLNPRRVRNWALLAASLIGPWAAILRRWMTAD